MIKKEKLHVRGALVTEKKGPGLKAMQTSVVTQGRVVNDGTAA